MNAAARRGDDVVSAVTVFVALLLLIPSPLIVKPLGASGTPANLVGMALLCWWGWSKMGADPGIDRGPQPVRVGIWLLLLVVVASLTGLFSRPFVAKELTGAARGMLLLAGWFGVALCIADGITSLERLHALLRRTVHGLAAIALLGVVEFFTGFNAGQTLAVPGLTRNLELPEQSRLFFVRVQSTALHPIEFGTVLGLALPLAVHYATHAATLRGRVVGWIEVAVIGSALPMALSRTGIIAAAVGLLTLAAHWTWRARATALVIAAAFLGALRLAIPGLIDTLVVTFTTVREDSSTTGRTGRYDIAYDYFVQHPWFGRGLDTLHPATQQIFDNQYLYLVIELGIVGLAVVVGFFVMLICIARSAKRRSADPMTSGLAQALSGIFVAFALVFATADMLSFAMAMGLLFLLAGSAGALWRLTRAIEPAQRTEGTAVAGVATPSAAPARALAAANPRRTPHSS